MAKNIEIRCNFVSVFAKYDTIEEIKAVANNIRTQLIEAYEVRCKEITSGQTDVAVEITSVKAAAAKTETKSKKDKAAKTKTAETPKADGKTKTAGDTDTLIAITDIQAIKKLGLTFEKYNDRCWVLRGDTKPLRKILKEQFKGVFNSHLSGGEGWVIKTANVEECAKALGLKLPKAA